MARFRDLPSKIQCLKQIRPAQVRCERREDLRTVPGIRELVPILNAWRRDASSRCRASFPTRPPREIVRP